MAYQSENGKLGRQQVPSAPETFGGARAYTGANESKERA